MNPTSPRQNHKALTLLALFAMTTRADAHASEQSLVLLLPTDIYTGAGVAVVALTVVLVSVLPAGPLLRLLMPLPLTRFSAARIRPATSTLAALFLGLMIWAGLTGSRDPTANPMPLFTWTVFWIGFVTVQGLIGDLWFYLNPFSGPLSLIRRVFGPQPYPRLPPELGHGLGIVAFLAFAWILLADPAPSDPARLARYAATYWLFTMIMAVIHGPRWLRRAEGFTLMFNAYARVSVFGRYRGKLCLGFPGWQALVKRPPLLGPALIMIILLGTGSFDGLNETFWWLGLNDINPLEFPGRSAVIWQNTLGLLIANILLILTVTLTTTLGMRLIKVRLSILEGLRLFAASILPIALGYHIAHYLTSFLVDGQYTLVALSDPFLTGADYLGLGQFYVSTGFFTSTDTVRTIFLTEAGAVVIGHVLAVMLAHAIALRAFATNRRAAISQAPLALFMIAYTLFGLWLLASPRF